MVDRDSRNRLAETLRHYVSGRVTNDDLADIDVNREDRGAMAVYLMSWRLYDDLYQHKATDSHYLDKGARREISRWIAFLYLANQPAYPGLVGKNEASEMAEIRRLRRLECVAVLLSQGLQGSHEAPESAFRVQ